MFSLRQSLAAAAMITAIGSVAHATDLYTTVLQSVDGSNLSCAIVNVSSSPIVVTAAVESFIDGSDITAQAVCPVPPSTLAPGHGCFANASQLGAHAGYCHFTASTTRVRGNLIVFGSNGEIVASAPATR
jgi:hypothetical protein